MVVDLRTEVNGAAVGVEMSPGIATSKSRTRAVRMSSKLAIIREEADLDDSDQAYDAPSMSTSTHSSTPRSSLSTHSAEDELVVVFDTKCSYMDQNEFDQIMRDHCIEEEVSHRISRVETNIGELIPDAQWDDPCLEFFPVRCIYRKIVVDDPASPPASNSSSESISTQVSLSTHGGEDELVVIFESKDDYVNQEVFDKIMREHGIEEEVSHRISRVETNVGEPLPDAQWDDPCLEFFPLWCFYRRLPKDNAQSSLAKILSTTPLVTAPKTPMTHNEGCSTAPSHCFATDPAPKFPHRGSPMTTHPSLCCAPWRSENSVTAISPVSVPYQVQIPSGIRVRMGPHMVAPPTAAMMFMGEVFYVCESVFGTDGWRHVKLTDGRGWVPAEALDSSGAFDVQARATCWARCLCAKLVGVPPGLDAVKA